MISSFFTLSTVLGLVASMVIPLLSSLLVKAHWPAEVAGILTTVLSVGDGFVAEWARDGSRFDWRHAAAVAVGALLVAFQARARIWLGSSADQKLLAVGSKPITPHPMPGPGVPAPAPAAPAPAPAAPAPAPQPAPGTNPTA